MIATMSVNTTAAGSKTKVEEGSCGLEAAAAGGIIPKQQASSSSENNELMVAAEKKLCGEEDVVKNVIPEATDPAAAAATAVTASLLDAESLDAMTSADVAAIDADAVAQHAHAHTNSSRNAGGSCLLTDESESSCVSALTPKGALLRSSELCTTPSLSSSSACTPMLREPASVKTPLTTMEGKFTAAEYASISQPSSLDSVVATASPLASADDDVVDAVAASTAVEAATRMKMRSQSRQKQQQQLKRQRRHARQVVHAACQSVLAVLRADPRYVSAARFTEELSVHEVYISRNNNSLHLALQQVLQKTAAPPSQSQSDTDVGDDNDDDDDDDDYYLDTFCAAVRRQDVSAAVTGAVLTALHTLVQNRLIAGRRLAHVAVALVHCAFEETTNATTSASTTTSSSGALLLSASASSYYNSTSTESGGTAVPAATTATVQQQQQPALGRRRSSIMAPPPPLAHGLEESRSGSAEDEQVVLKLLQLCVLTVQTAAAATAATVVVNPAAEAAATCPLAPTQITALLDTCWHVRHKAATASPLLKQAAAFSAKQIVSAVFASSATTTTTTTASLSATRCLILRNLANLVVVPTDEDVAIHKAAAAGVVSPTHEFVAIHALQLLMAVLETSDVSFGAVEREILEGVVARDVIALAVQTSDSSVLQHCLRVVHELLHCLHLRHLKCELEVFVHAVYLRRLDKDSTSTPEEKEVVLDSLLELCYGGSCAPLNLQDLYLNYDCDNACTNLYEAVIAALAKTARPANWTTPDKSDEARKKNAASIAVTETNTASLSASSVHSTATHKQQSAEGSTSRGIIQPPVTLSSALMHSIAPTTTVPASALSGKPVQTVTVVNQAPLNHLNRLALEGILSALALIAQRCHHEEESSKSTSAVSKYGMEALDDDDDGLRSACFGSEALSEEALRAKKQTKNSLAKVVQIFNAGNPDKGEWLKVAVAEGLLESTKDSKAVAELLHKAPEDLDKQRLGIYLSRGPDKTFPFQAGVRGRFAAIQDFSGLSFAAGLRKFLSKFRLPGEAQCIDRLMEAFSKEFFKQQCGSSFFKNADAVYVLAFSTIMLNTDLHNPTIKAERRMTKEQFVKNNRGINGGDDLSEAFISDLYDQIKGRALQVRSQVSDFMKKNKEDYKTAWEGVVEKKGEIATPVTVSTDSGKRRSGLLDRDMFLILANSSVQAFIGIFMRSWDDALVVRTLRGLKQMVKLAAYFDLDCVVNDVLQVLLPQGRDYIMNCIAQDQSDPIGMEGGASAETPMRTRNPSISESAGGEDETTIGAENDQLIPFGLLCSNDEHGHVDISGSASNRGLLALDSSFVLLRKNSTLVTDAWPAFIECLCALRDARALPAGLSDLGDFADSNGKVLPLSSFARASQKRLDAYHRSLSDKDTTKNKGWFRSFFRKGKIEDHNESTDDDADGSPRGELSVYARTLLGVAEAADVENIVQMGSSQLPNATIRTLIDVLDAYPFENDPAGEHHAVFTLELAARALLSNRERAEELFELFLSKFERILVQAMEKENDVPAPFVIERIVVTILRSNIHLYEYPELRPQLRASLQLLTMTLPRSFIRAISDRMACGLAIILRASFHFFETHKEWTFMGDTLDVLANYSPSRVFVFDGIASTVEYALPRSYDINPNKYMDDEVEDEDDRPQLSLEACSALARILTRFVLGFYQNDLSLSVPAMLCLEKVYRRKAEILLQAEPAKDGTEVRALDLLSSVPDKELWQNVAVAVYSVCRSPDPDVSTEGLQCYRRIVLRTSVDQVPEDKWVAIMHLMVNKQPPLIAEISRGNTFSVLGHLLTRVLPSISHQAEHREDLEDLVKQYAALAEENLQQSRRGCLFEKTLQTLTYLSNHMVSDEWVGDKEFSAWASETLLKELESAGEGGKLVTTASAEDDMSEISDSVAEDEDNDVLGSRR